MKRILNSIFVLIFITILFSCKNSFNEQIPSIELKMPGTITNSRYALDNKRFTVDLIQNDEIVTSDFALSGEAVYFYWIEPGFYTLRVQVFDISDVENEFLEYFGESEEFEVIRKETTDVTVTLKYVAEKDTDNEDEIKDEDKNEDNDPIDEDDDNTDDDVFIKIGGFQKYDNSVTKLSINGVRYFCNYKVPTEIQEGSTIVLDIKGTTKLSNFYAQFVPTDTDNNVHNLYFQHNSYYEYSLGDDNNSWELILPLNFVKFYESASVSPFVDEVPDGSKYDTIQFFFDDSRNFSDDELNTFNKNVDINVKMEIFTPEKKHLEFLRSQNYDDSTKQLYPCRFYVDYIIGSDEVAGLTPGNNYKFEVDGTLVNNISDTTNVNLIKNDGSWEPPYSSAVLFNLKETNTSSEFQFNYVQDVLLQITVPCTKDQLLKRVYIDNFEYKYVPFN